MDRACDEPRTLQTGEQASHRAARDARGCGQLRGGETLIRDLVQQLQHGELALGEAVMRQEGLLFREEVAGDRRDVDIGLDRSALSRGEMVHEVKEEAQPSRQGKWASHCK